MRLAGVAHLVEHRADLLDELREPCLLLLLRKQEATGRRNDDIIVAARQHRAPVGAGRYDVAGRKRRPDLQRCRLKSLAKNTHVSGFLRDDPGGGAAVRHRRSCNQEQNCSDEMQDPHSQVLLRYAEVNPEPANQSLADVVYNQLMLFGYFLIPSK